MQSCRHTSKSVSIRALGVEPWASAVWGIKPITEPLPEVWELKPTLEVERSRSCGIMPGSSGRQLVEDAETPLLCPQRVIPDVD